MPRKSGSEKRKKKHEFAAFELLVTRVRSEKVLQWALIEEEFLRGVELFDTEYAQGAREKGWYQSKARYFNDLIVQLLANLSGKDIASRSKRGSQLFGKIDIDICYPRDGAPIVAGEVKALGTPPHPGNKGRARAGAADLHKRVREVALTSVDLKAAYAPATQISSLQQWVGATSPGYFGFWAIRGADDKDVRKVSNTLSNLRDYCNGVAAVIYTPARIDAPTTYQAKRLSHLDIDKTLREMAQRIA